MPSVGMTLYVVRANRTPEIAADTVAAARWASAQACSVALVVPAADRAAYNGCGADYVYGSDVPRGSGDFAFGDALAQAWNDGLEFEQAICLRDDATFLGKRVDEIVAGKLQQESADLFGVANDQAYYADNFLRVGAFFSQWRVPHESWDRAPTALTLHTALFAMTSTLVGQLFNRRLLLPANYTDWPMPYGPYLTWTCQLLGMTVATAGGIQRPAPPFYVNDSNGGAYNPPPYLLAPSVVGYWSMRHVSGYSETETRAWCRMLRQANP